MAIADVIKKGTYYQVLDASGKKIKEVHESVIGQMLNFSSSFIVCRKGNYYATYDETFKNLRKFTEVLLGNLEMPQVPQ